jgi:hypothetical protein
MQVSGGLFGNVANLLQDFTRDVQHVIMDRIAEIAPLFVTSSFFTSSVILKKVPPATK